MVRSSVGGRGPEGARRLKVALNCTVCGSRNYKRSRPRRDGQSALELKKFCKTCGAHTVHVESH